MAASRRRSAFGFSTNMRVAMRAAPATSAARCSAFGDRRRKPRAPACERLPRFCEACEHQRVLVLAEPVAQPLRFAAPHLNETRPQRLDDVDLITVDHDALAQFVQFLRVGGRPIRRKMPSRAAIETGELIGDVIEGQGGERPALDHRGRLIECAAEPQAHVGIERSFRRLPDGFNSLPQSSLSMANS